MQTRKRHLTQGSETLEGRRIGRLIPFVLVAPATVLAIGTLVVLLLAYLGVTDFTAHARESDARARAVIGVALGEKLRNTSRAEAARLLEEAQGVTGGTFLLLGESDEIIARAGDTTSRTSRGTNSAHLVQLPQGRKLVVATPPSDTLSARSELVGAVALFAALVLAASAFVAWTLARDVHADMQFLRGLIVTMVSENSPEARLIPVRTIDQVGQLTASFNMLLERFYAAQRAYRADVERAGAFDKDRSAFLAALSHELRTPLNGILGFTDVLLSELDGPLTAESRENLTIVRTSAEHLRSLIDDVLAFSALESGQFRLSREELDLYQVASDVVSEAKVTAAQKGLRIELRRDTASGPTVAQADRRRMRQVLQNVVSNAIKFTSQGRVTVAVARRDDEVLLSVEDTGPGIDKADLESIFREFSQSSAGTAQRTGTGLGLAITQRLVDLHSGRIEVRSELGRGSTFVISIPVKAEGDIKIVPHPRLSQPPRPDEAALDPLADLGGEKPRSDGS
jgi:signal transduction histidine kinase